MALPVATSEVLEFTKGDTVTWRVNYSDYPANDSWVLTYYLRGPANFSFVATADGPTHVVLVPAADTATYEIGRYLLVGLVSKGAERKQVYSGQVLVKEDWANQEAGFDPRSHARKCLDAIEAVLEGRATRSDQTYQVGGRSVSHYSFEELTKMRDYYLAEVAAEEALNGPGNKYIYARFREWR